MTLLEEFLGATDLDTALHAHDAITEVSRDDAAALTEMVVAWDDGQPLANLLMFPELIPAPYREFALLRGLATDHREYILVAAVVGLSRFEMPDQYRSAVASRLVDLIATESEPIASLASVALGPFAYDLDVGETMAAMRNIVGDSRRTVLSAMISEFGLDDVRRHLARVRNDASVTESLADEIGALLDEIGANPAPAPLTRIPDRTEWIARPKPGAYPF